MDDYKEFIKNVHQHINNGELIQCKECWIHCLLKSEDVGRYKVIDGECQDTRNTIGDDEYEGKS